MHSLEGEDLSKPQLRACFNRLPNLIALYVHKSALRRGSAQQMTTCLTGTIAYRLRHHALHLGSSWLLCTDHGPALHNHGWLCMFGMGGPVMMQLHYTW